eukprot:344441-Amphidinium_carterae.1
MCNNTCNSISDKLTVKSAAGPRTSWIVKKFRPFLTTTPNLKCRKRPESQLIVDLETHALRAPPENCYKTAKARM